MENPNSGGSGLRRRTWAAVARKLNEAYALDQYSAAKQALERLHREVVEKLCANVKRWHGGDQRERRVGSGLLVAERQFRKVNGCKLISVLLRELESLSSKSPAAKPVAKFRESVVKWWVESR